MPIRQWMEQLMRKARDVKRGVYALYLACRDPRMPWYAKLFALGIVAYVFSPIDLIPDFIPVLGYVDELVLVPIGITLAMRMVPAAVREDALAKAEEARRGGKPRSWTAAALFIAIWLLFAVWLSGRLYRAVLE